MSTILNNAVIEMVRWKTRSVIILTVLTISLLYFINSSLCSRKLDTKKSDESNIKVKEEDPDVKKFASIPNNVYWSTPNRTQNIEKFAEPKWVVGNNTSQVKMVFGIPSIERSGEDYIYATMKSLIQQTTADVILSNNVVFLIYIADANNTVAEQRAAKLQQLFAEEINIGIIKIISSPNILFPDWESNLFPGFDDYYKRVKWRSKQNLDMRFLLSYSRRHFNPQYFLMMEDDIEAIKNYLQHIIEFIEKESDEWLICDFSNIGGAGKLLNKVSMYDFERLLTTFWNAKPLDWLLWDYLKVKLCGYGGKEVELRCNALKKKYQKTYKPFLFLHKGKKSSGPK